MTEAEPDEVPPVEEERRYPSTIGGAFYLLILGAMAAGIVAAYVDDWRLGVRIVGARPRRSPRSSAWSSLNATPACSPSATAWSTSRSWPPWVRR